MKRTIVAVAVVIVAAASVLMFEVKLRSKMRDFEVYHTAARRAARAETLYRTDDGHYQHKYFPAFAVALIPVGALPLDRAKALWLACSVAFLAALIASSVRALPHHGLPTSILVAITILTLAKFYGHELVLGQTNVLFALLVVLAIAEMPAGRDVSAGALTGLSLWVKPYALVFLPYFLLVRRPRAAAAMAAVSALGLVLPAVSYGWSGNLALLSAWYATVTGTTASTLTSQDNVSIFALAGKWMGETPGAMAVAALIAVVLAAAGLLMLKWRTAVPRPEYLEMAALLTLIPLLSPQGWDYALLVSTPLVVCLVNAWPALARPWRVVLAATLAAIGSSLYDVLGRELYARFMALSLITVLYLVLLGIAVHVRRRALA